MDNRTVKYNEEVPRWDSLSDDEFLSKVGVWMNNADKAAENGHNLVFVGRQSIGRLLELARRNHDNT